jgi:hypothetical protein
MGHLGSHWTDLNEIQHLSMFGKSGEKIRILLKYEKMTANLRKDQCTFIVIYRPVLLRVRNI